ncbi:MAG: GNAT family N-acetyltransferase, partial [Chloroflexi bacterium]|nr:GNAT family N-acetyltransferase [Chloroflexota bacterium]
RGPRHDRPGDDAPGITLTVDGLLLRPWHADDAPAVQAACQDPDIAHWLALPDQFGPDEAMAFIEDANGMGRDGTGTPFAVVDVTSDQLLGAVTRFGPEGHVSTFGCWVAPEARGRGVGSQALQLLAEWTFATTPTVRIDGSIMVGNEASERMVLRLGWQREGILRAYHLRSDGAPVDCVVYSILRGDASASG